MPAASLRRFLKKKSCGHSRKLLSTKMNQKDLSFLTIQA